VIATPKQVARERVIGSRLAVVTGGGARARIAFTLVEVVVSLAIFAVLTLGLGSALVISAHSLDHSMGTTAGLTGSRQVLDTIDSDLRFATSLETPAAGEVVLSVPDRDGDGTSETIRYVWEGVSGGDPGPLKRQRNAGPVVVVAEDVDDFSVGLAARWAVAAPVARGTPGDPVVLMVVADDSSLGAVDVARDRLLDRWGYTVTLISSSASQAVFDSAAAAADVVYIPAHVTTAGTGSKLRTATIGVVNESLAFDAELGLSDRPGLLEFDTKMTEIKSHAIMLCLASQGFKMSLCDSAQPLRVNDGDLGDAIVLGLTNGVPALAVIEDGATLVGGGVAGGVRVFLPWGGPTFDVGSLSGIGRTMLHRSLAWAGGGGGLPPSFGVLGHDTVFATPAGAVRQIQIATRATLGADGTVTAMSAYTFGKKKIRMAIYDDLAGEPGALLVETGRARPSAPGPIWTTLGVTPTALPAGDYWLAVAFEHSSQQYYHQAGGETRYRNHDAVGGGYLSNWGTADDSFQIDVSIYAMISVD